MIREKLLWESKHRLACLKEVDRLKNSMNAKVDFRVEFTEKTKVMYLEKTITREKRTYNISWEQLHINLYATSSFQGIIFSLNS